MSAISIVEDGRYYIKSGYANNGCAHEGKDKHNGKLPFGHLDLG